MELSLENRVAVVTGGSEGIGAGISRSLVDEGAIVYAIARGRENLERLRSEIGAKGKSLRIIVADLRLQHEVKSAIQEIISDSKKIDILINNVGGVNKFGGFDDLDEQDWVDSFDLNVLTMIRMIKECDQYLSMSKHGRIINISSISAVQPGNHNPHYTAMKAATLNLSKYFANHFVKRKILVNAVCPGPVFSESWAKNVAQMATLKGISPEDAEAQFRNEESLKIPLARIGMPEDVGSIVCFLASERASWITGSCFHVNGGKFANIA